MVWVEVGDVLYILRTPTHGVADPEVSLWVGSPRSGVKSEPRQLVPPNARRNSFMDGLFLS
jgi:hypothetical protein